MKNHRVIKDGCTTVLQREKSDGEYIDLVTVITSDDIRVAVIHGSYHNSLRFKSETGENLKHSTVNGMHIIKFTGQLDAYMLPHHTELQRVIMSESYNRYSFANARFTQGQEVDSIQLDYDGIVHNMLEFIGRL